MPNRAYELHITLLQVVRILDVWDTCRDLDLLTHANSTNLHASIGYVGHPT